MKPPLMLKPLSGAWYLTRGEPYEGFLLSSRECWELYAAIAGQVPMNEGDDEDES